MLVEDMLIELGHTVTATAGRLDRAIELARTADVDFAIVDLNIAGERSYPVAEILRARGAPLVFATGYGADGLSESLADVVVLQKPFQLWELREAIAAALNRRDR